MNMYIQKYSLRDDTNKYTSKDILEEVKEDIEILKSLGHNELENNSYRIKLSGNLKKAYAYISFEFIDMGGTRHYSITVNSLYMKTSRPEEFHNTLMHECIHSCDGCWNHGKEFLQVGEEVIRKYNFTPISRCGNSEEYKKALVQKAKYTFTCTECQHEWHYYRYPSKVMKAYNANHCKCPFCGCKKFEYNQNY